MNTSCYKMFGFAFLLSAAASATTVSLPPYTIVGRATDWYGRSLAGRDATVCARVDGVLVATSKVSEGYDSDCNFRLQIPMASVAGAGQAARGSMLTVDVYEQREAQNVTVKSTAALTAGAPGSVAQTDLLVGATVQKEGWPGAVSQVYLDLMADYMDEAGIKGEWDPLADYDHDGASNWQEYLSGTDPFLAEDNLRIVAFDKVSADLYSLKYVAAANRAYHVMGRASLNDKDGFAHEDHKESPEGAQRAYDKTDEAGDGVRTLYVPATGSSRFFGVGVK